MSFKDYCNKNHCQNKRSQSNCLEAYDAGKQEVIDNIFEYTKNLINIAKEHCKNKQDLQDKMFHMAEIRILISVQARLSEFKKGL